MEYSQFITRVQKDADLNDPNKADRVTRAVLGTLGELLTEAGRHHLEAQLPKQLKQYIYSWDYTLDAEKPVAGLSEEKIINRIQARADLNHRETMKGITSVVKVMRQAISAGELKELEDKLQRLESMLATMEQTA